MEKQKILFVDDDPNILQAFKRQLRSRFDMHTATGPQEGIKSLQTEGPYAVVISDMKMPEMSGVEFLKEVERYSPNTVRLMLTGNVDQDTAVLAVNEGHIFRFLNKPCSTDDLAEAVDAALKQYRLITAEKDLLQRTLTGSVKALTDILSLMDPASFGDAVNLREPIRELAPLLGVEQTWELELTAMLKNIGKIVIPPAVATKVAKGEALSQAEQQMVAKAPEVSRTLLQNIPRLEKVAELIYMLSMKSLPEPTEGNKHLIREVRALRLITHLVQEEKKRGSRAAALQALLDSGEHDQGLIGSLLEQLSIDVSNEEQAEETQIFEIQLAALCPGQIIMEDVYGADEVLIVTAGHIVTDISFARIKNYAEHRGLKTNIKVNCLTPTEG